MAYARVLLSAAKIDEPRVVPALVDPRFPLDRVALLPDTSTVNSPPPRPPFPASAVSATVREWRPGAMTIILDGAERVDGHLLVSEN